MGTENYCASIVITENIQKNYKQSLILTQLPQGKYQF